MGDVSRRHGSWFARRFVPGGWTAKPTRVTSPLPSPATFRQMKCHILLREIILLPRSCPTEGAARKGVALAPQTISQPLAFQLCLLLLLHCGRLECFRSPLHVSLESLKMSFSHVSLAHHLFTCATLACLSCMCLSHVSCMCTASLASLSVVKR